MNIFLMLASARQPPIKPMDKRSHLLDVVSVTATNNSFIVKQAFLSHEATEDNRWLVSVEPKG